MVLAAQGVADLVTLATESMMKGSGFVEVVSRAMLREQAIPETNDRVFRAKRHPPLHMLC
jgi:hypothetical protein